MEAPELIGNRAFDGLRAAGPDGAIRELTRPAGQVTLISRAGRRQEPPTYSAPDMKADMENFKLVLPEHLNHYGYLFGGNLLKWVDESAYIAARREYPALEFVTVSMNRVEFRQRVELGSILVFDVGQAQAGITSLTYPVKVFLGGTEGPADRPVFSTTVTFVCIDQDGNKRSLPPHS